MPSWYYTHKQIIWAIITIIIMMGVLQGVCAYLILLERKLCAYMQDRIGPNRVGPKGLLQPIADGIKFLFKEDIVPAYVDKILYFAAPAIAVGTATLAFAVVPFGPTKAPGLLAPTPPQPPANLRPADQAQYKQAVDAYNAQRADYEKKVSDYEHSYQFVIAPRIDIGLVFVFAITSLAVYGIILAGWASNNKYSFIGSLRSSAQLVSYEIPMGMSVLGVFLLTGSLNLEHIIGQQASNGWWLIGLQPVGFLLFMIAAFAECNRLPFDLPEAEQELVGGYHTEYSSMKFALFFLGEYTHMVTTSFLLTIIFLGGWHFWYISTPESGPIIKVVIIWLKMTGFILFYMLIRWTLPRFRFDQLMALAWKVLIPLAFANLIATMVVLQLIKNYHADPAWRWILLPIGILIFLAAAIPAVWRRGTPGRPPRTPVRAVPPLASVR